MSITEDQRQDFGSCIIVKIILRSCRLFEARIVHITNFNARDRAVLGTSLTVIVKFEYLVDTLCCLDCS